MIGKKHKILLILPAHNEEGKIGPLVHRVPRSAVTTTLVVTDGNTDRTVEEARKAGAKVINFAKRRGIGAAIRSGIDYAIKHKYDIFVIMGGDNQDDPREIPRLIKKIDKGFDFVHGSRYIPGGRTVNQPLFRLLTTKIYTWFFSLMTGRWMTDASNGFRAFRTEIVRDLDLWRKDLDGYELEPFLLYDVATRFHRAEVPVTKSYDLERGYTKMRPILDWWVILVPVIKKRLGLY